MEKLKDMADIIYLAKTSAFTKQNMSQYIFIIVKLQLSYFYSGFALGI